MQTEELIADIKQFNLQVNDHENEVANTLLKALNMLLDNLHNVIQRQALSDWANASLKTMLQAKTIEAFQICHENFTQALHAIEQATYKNTHSNYAEISQLTGICLANLNNLETVRISYLENLSSYASHAKNFGWILLGAALIVVGFVVPPVAIVLVSLGVAGLAYGIVDFAKEASTQYMENRLPKLGKKPATDTITGKNHSKKSQNKVFKIAALTASSIGLLSGFAAAIIVIPALAALFPPALPIVLGVIGLTAATLAAGVYAHQVYREYKKFQTVKIEQQAIQAAAEQKLAEVAKNELDSTALLEKAMLHVKDDEKLNEQQKTLLQDEIKNMDIVLAAADFNDERASQTNTQKVDEPEIIPTEENITEQAADKEEDDGGEGSNGEKDENQNDTLDDIDTSDEELKLN